MSLFLLNVLLAIGFMSVLDSFNLQSLLAGFGVGLGALWLTRPAHTFNHLSARTRTSVFQTVDAGGGEICSASLARSCQELVVTTVLLNFDFPKTGLL